MNKNLGITLAVIGGVVVAVLVFGTALFLGHSNVFANNYTLNGIRGQTINNPGYSMMGGYNMMGGFNTTGSFEKKDPTNINPLTVDQTNRLSRVI